MDACFYETSAEFHGTTWHYIPENITLQEIYVTNSLLFIFSLRNMDFLIRLVFLNLWHKTRW